MEKRWRATAVQDATRDTVIPRNARSVLDCASPLALCQKSKCLLNFHMNLCANDNMNCHSARGLRADFGVPPKFPRFSIKFLVAKNIIAGSFRRDAENNPPKAGTTPSRQLRCQLTGNRAWRLFEFRMVMFQFLAFAHQPRAVENHDQRTDVVQDGRDNRADVTE